MNTRTDGRLRLRISPRQSNLRFRQNVREEESKQNGDLLMRVNYAIVFVSDMKRSVEFYRDVLGLPLKFESPGWTEFATDGATLALHACKESTPAEDEYERPGRWRSGFSVPDLDA